MTIKLNTIRKPVLLALPLVIGGLLLLSKPNFYSRDHQLENSVPAQKFPVDNRLTHPRRPVEQNPSMVMAQYERLAVMEKDPAPVTDSSRQSSAEDWSLTPYRELARIAALENQPADSTLGEIMTMLARDNPVIRLAALESLADSNHPTRLPVLVAMLDDPLPQIRIAALEALADANEDSSIGIIEIYLYDFNTGVRIAAIDALGEFESEAAIPALAGLLSDPDSMVRQHAVIALGEIGGDQAAGYLEQMCHDRVESIRGNAIAILCEQGYRSELMCQDQSSDITVTPLQQSSSRY